MDTPSGGRQDSRFSMGYNISLLSGESPPDIYGGHSRPSTSITSGMSRGVGLSSQCLGSRGLKRSSSDVCYDGQDRQIMSGECGSDIVDDSFSSPAQQKGSPPANGKKTKGRVKIKMEYIDNKLRRYTTFSKRKTGIMKKAYELSTLTGTQVMLLVASETGHVYTFATRKLQPMITSEAGKALIQTCLNSPDPCPGGSGGDQRMSATGFEETELSYNIADEEQKVRQLVYGGGAGLMQHGGGHGGGSGGVMGPPHHPSSPHHHHLMLHQSSPSHLIPCSSPSGYQQACPSPLPHYPPHPHMQHSHPQR